MEKGEIKVTVLMPVFNGEKYLKQAIDSILSQTYKNFEFLIIDDGSKDKSIKIIKKYKDPRIRLVRNKKNIGLIKTLNKGLSLSRGKYIARMDCDDISLPERLEKQVEFMEQHPDIGVCGTALELIDKEVKWYYPTDPDYLKCKLLFICCIPHPTVMFRKKVLENIKYRKYEHAEDYYLWVALSEKTKLVTLPEVLLKYRQHPNQVSNKFSIKQHLNSHRIILEQLERLNITPTEQEFWIHLRLADNMMQTTELAQRWCEKILEKNKETNIYNQDALQELLEKVLRKEVIF
ncbi:glycosyltransferase family 2 protein [Peribacillus deserti]|uniref:Lacto-N-neotetraose biosynthesis glycosyl transferase n=1 Tax=Peribacillus deserti TaxID=673318 RepID=A0A2N5M096_9BACI|nr:glycosyltransferase [Peribacillus deserti]PLT27789.1 lacto-N-neotetraose biosynthesis glycosyl transferase [Peribacillus deserti]